MRRLRERGHSVRCALSRNAGSFVAPLTLEVLSGHPVYGEAYLQANHSGEELHLTAAGWADVFCVAPATCSTLAKLALGLADDFLSTSALAFVGPVVAAPAMDSVMWGQAAVARNVDELRRRGVVFAGPVVGALASGGTGVGRMADVLEIVYAVESAAQRRDLEGRTVLVTAGPTREPLDPVRFLSNRSSGRMGFALARAAAARGARTLLVSGPVELPTPPAVERHDVVTARQMEETVRRLASEADLTVMAAAVSDFRPRMASDAKLKKSAGPPRVELEANPDILMALAAVAPAAVRVGFAAETGDPRPEARRKLEAKHADFMVGNDVSRPGVGFESDENAVVVCRRGAGELVFERQSKGLLAARLMDLFAEEVLRRERQPAVASQ